MPHGLTPLGRQLRSVIAALGPSYHEPRYIRPLTRSWTRPISKSPGHIGRPQDVAQRTARYYGAAAAAQQEERQDVEGEAPARKARPTTPIDPSLRPVSRARLVRRRRIDHLGEELKNAGRSDVAPRQYPGKKDMSHFNPRSRHGLRVWTENQKRHAKDYTPDTDASQASGLTRILALYLRRMNVDIGGLHPEWTDDFKLSRWDREILRSKGYDIDDLKAWAGIITDPDPYRAVVALTARTTSHGIQAVPLPIFSYILRRPSLSPKALRLLIEHAWFLFEDLESYAKSPSNPNEVFVVFVRLARSAAQSWPQALPSITEFLTKFMPDARRNGPIETLEAIRMNSFLLNRAMLLVAHPTAQSPYKDNPHQEAAIVNVLAYMTNHDPPLQIDRSGYRAVIRIQLAQKKTSSDKLWAELKALSWPPWKEERTRMDSEVGLEYGVSKAGDTLRRMAEAGYAHEPWEQVAKIYAGWDTDQTPTIQTRTILFGRSPSQLTDAAVWAARIGTTRTLQEAWACYLACEDAKHALDQDILLAIFEKLLEEQKRLKRVDRKCEEGDRSANERLLPGDAREIAPLPPSTHLYTYTRRQPPSLHEFFDQLEAQGVQLKDRALAFRIANAGSFDAGVKHLTNASELYPGINSLLVAGAAVEFSRVPACVVEAYIALLVKTFGYIGRRARFMPHFRPLLAGDRDEPSHTLHTRHSLVHAISLLQSTRPRRLVPWNNVLLGLGNVTHTTTPLLITSNNRAPLGADPPTLSRKLNVLASYRLSCHVLSLLSSEHMDLDRAGFMALCHSTENVAIASWRALAGARTSKVNNNNDSDVIDLPPLAALEARALLARHEPQRRIQGLFRTLIGSTSVSRHAEISRSLPRLLSSPGPAILHAYIRALGWCAAHDGLLQTVRWMVEHRAELEEAEWKDRRGRNMMRKVVIALRVFLERSWVDGASAADDGEGDGNEILARLRAKASEPLVQEVKAMVESVEEWGGWPGDEAVERYLQNLRFEDAK